MSNISHDPYPRESRLEVITDVAENDRLLSTARQQHKKLYEEQAGIMLPDGLEWRLRAVGRSAVAWALDRQIEEFYQHFNAIHHIAGMHELALQAGDTADSVHPDFIHSSQTASYDEGFTIPRVLEPYVGMDAAKDADMSAEVIRVGLLSERYYANTVSSWNPRRELWSEVDDGRRYYSLAATIYRVTDREAMFDKNNAK